MESSARRDEEGGPGEGLTDMATTLRKGAARLRTRGAWALRALPRTTVAARAASIAGAIVPDWSTGGKRVG